MKGVGYLKGVQDLKGVGGVGFQKREEEVYRQRGEQMKEGKEREC